MKTHIYAFGSICRGDVRPESDVDLLAIVDGFDERFSQDVYSIYSYQRIEEIWDDGNPFAWHLATEAKLLFSADGSDFLNSLGKPNRYQAPLQDCDKFFRLFSEARASFLQNHSTRVFDLSMVFLGIRNLATCFSLGCLQQADFSRHSARRIGDWSIPIALEPYTILERCRILCTRGVGPVITDSETELAAGQFSAIEEWMVKLLSEASRHGA